MKKIVYMDAAASWLKPKTLIRAQADFLQNLYANAGRGVCARAGHVDEMVADARRVVAEFIGAKPENIVWVSGTTDAMNRIVSIVSNSWNKKCPVVAVSDLDHHSARLPWEMCAKSGVCKISVMPLNPKFDIDDKKLPRADVMVITAMSNVLGRQQNLRKIIKAARLQNPNVITIVDAAQSVVHSNLDVKKIDCDFLCFSGHKIGADTGVGVMYVKDINKWSPDKFGGGMVKKITESGIVFAENNEKFEAGTLPLTQIVGMPYAIEYLKSWGGGGQELIHYMYDELSKINRVKILTTRDAFVLSFVVRDMHVLDFGAMIGANNICIRVGNMCATWIHNKLGVDGSIRISVGPWNTAQDAVYVVNTIKKLVK
jgi:selenocysteine lyase/cysteine desulfurase